MKEAESAVSPEQVLQNVGNAHGRAESVSGRRQTKIVGEVAFADQAKNAAEKYPGGNQKSVPACVFLSGFGAAGIGAGGRHALCEFVTAGCWGANGAFGASLSRARTRDPYGLPECLQ